MEVVLWRSGGSVARHVRFRWSSEGNQTGKGGGGPAPFPAEGKIPFNVQLLVCPHREWSTRYRGLVGFRQWLDAFTHWLNLIDVRFPGEIGETLQYLRKLTKADMDPKQYERREVSDC